MAGRPTEWTEERAIELGESLLEWMKQDESRIYWFEFIVVERGLYKQLASDLAKKYPAFAELLKRAKDLQELRLLKKEGKGEIKSMFVLKNHHGYADKQEIKSDNINRNLDAKDLQAATESDLMELARTLTEEPK